MAKEIKKRELSEIEKEELKSELRTKEGCGDVEWVVQDNYDFLNK